MQKLIMRLNIAYSLVGVSSLKQDVLAIIDKSAEADGEV